MAEPTWKRYLSDYNEGLGLVYERFVLNDFLLALRKEHSVSSRCLKRRFLVWQAFRVSTVWPWLRPGQM